MVIDDVRFGTTLDALAELLGTVVLVQEIVRDFLQIGQVAVEQSTANGQKIGVAGVVHLNDTPWVLTGSYAAAVNLNNVLGSYYGKGHEATKLGVLLDCVLVVLLDVVGEVVDGDAVVLDILHDKLLRLGELSRCERIGLANDGDNVDTGREALHELNVEFAETTDISIGRVKTQS